MSERLDSELLRAECADAVCMLQSNNEIGGCLQNTAALQQCQKLEGYKMIVASLSALHSSIADVSKVGKVQDNSSFTICST